MTRRPFSRPPLRPGPRHDEPPPRPGPFEFDCVDCGRHIVLFGALMPEPARCGECRFIPGWHKNPDLRASLDPGMSAPEDGAPCPQAVRRAAPIRRRSML